ncbi:MAG: SGNH/GDSL hydrolase family protein [Syntrophomonadaceae bacterium]|nr:SGNH/GDSL hydrolase family protein [Syntrophomonadaceae bacterium]MDD4549825.1 SGNH/GDSL hydrolase family protein [Syntrophomonadaceae bacterium]
MENRRKIVCIGDSITYGFPFGPHESWVKMLDEVMEEKIINLGINGNTTGDMLRRFERAVFRHNPTHVIIMGGINDVICGESFDSITWNISRMVDLSLKHNIKVILGLPTAVDEPGWEKMIQRIRDWIIDYADQKHLAVINFARAFYDDNGELRHELLLDDGGHPSVKGYKAMFEQIDLNVFN